LDGEMRGSKRYLRHSASYLWWGGLLALATLLIGSAAVMVVEPLSRAVQTGSPQLVLDLVFGPMVGTLARFLLFIRYFGSVLIYLLVFSRALLLMARYECLSPYFVQLNREGTPQRVLFFQFIVIVSSSLLLFIIVPFVLKAFAPVPLVNAL